MTPGEVVGYDPSLFLIIFGACIFVIVHIMIIRESLIKSNYIAMSLITIPFLVLYVLVGIIVLSDSSKVFEYTGEYAGTMEVIEEAEVGEVPVVSVGDQKVLIEDYRLVLMDEGEPVSIICNGLSGNWCKVK